MIFISYILTEICHHTNQICGWTKYSVTVGCIHILTVEQHNTYQLFTTQSRLLTTLKEKALENTVRKGENAGTQHFLLFPQSFLLNQREKSSF